MSERRKSDYEVREQIEFYRRAMAAIEATSERGGLILRDEEETSDGYGQRIIALRWVLGEIDDEDM